MDSQNRIIIQQESHNRNLKILQKELGIHFQNNELLCMALTHSSFSSNKDEIKDNQRLELLGDSVLGLIVTEHLYSKFPSYQEGRITKIKNYLVSQSILSQLAKNINLGQYLLMSPAEDISGGRSKNSSLADAFEAIIGALYLDGGLEFARMFIIPRIEPEIHRTTESETFVSDYKSELQYLIQKKLKICPEYNILQEVGPNHNKTFTVGLFINNIFYAQGEAKNKKQAEQYAAEVVFEKITSGQLEI